MAILCLGSASAVISDEFDATVLKVAEALERVTGAEALQWKEDQEGEQQAFKSLLYKVCNSILYFELEVRHKPFNFSINNHNRILRS